MKFGIPERQEKKEVEGVCENIVMNGRDERKACRVECLERRRGELVWDDGMMRRGGMDGMIRSSGRFLVGHVQRHRLGHASTVMTSGHRDSAWVVGQ